MFVQSYHYICEWKLPDGGGPTNEYYSGGLSPSVNTTDTSVRISFAHLLRAVTTYFHSRSPSFVSDKLNFILVENLIAISLPILMLVIFAV